MSFPLEGGGRCALHYREHPCHPDGSSRNCAEASGSFLKLGPYCGRACVPRRAWAADSLMDRRGLERMTRPQANLCVFRFSQISANDALGARARELMRWRDYVVAAWSTDARPQRDTPQFHRVVSRTFVGSSSERHPSKPSLPAGAPDARERTPRSNSRRLPGRGCRHR